MKLKHEEYYLKQIQCGNLQSGPGRISQRAGNKRGQAFAGMGAFGSSGEGKLQSSGGDSSRVAEVSRGGRSGAYGDNIVDDKDSDQERDVSDGNQEFNDQENQYDESEDGK